MRRSGLIGLFIGEVLYLTTRFDTQVLDDAPSAWLRMVSWSSDYLRVAITVSVILLLLGLRAVWSLPAPSTSTPPARGRLAWLAAHALAFGLFTQVSAVLFDVTAASRHPAFWVTTWWACGAAALLTWTQALGFDRLGALVARRGLLVIGLALVLGLAAWSGGLLTEALWAPAPLARLTFGVVAAILGLIYPVVVSRPEKLILGTPDFKVAIAPSCSGYEGIGLILAFLGIYLWLFRRELRFPGALVLLPLGAVAIWTVNALRLVVLIVIGTSGWPAIALGGFHSQAGWLAFNAVGLAFVAVLNRGRFFRVDSTAAARPRVQAPADSTPAYLLPLLVVMASAMITGALSAGIDWLYPVRVVAAALVLWMFRRRYSALGWSLSWRAVAIGCLTFAVWIALVPAAATDGEGWPAALRSVPVHWAAAWLVLRVVGYTVTVPLVEELAFRGYLTRRLMQADFERLPVGLFSWSSFLLSSVMFGALHGGLWLAGTVAGMTFALALYQRRALGDAVVAHATTNGLIAVYVLATGRWSVWS